MSPSETSTIPATHPKQSAFAANDMMPAQTGIDTARPAANERPRPPIDPAHHLEFVRRLAVRMARSLPAHVCLDDLIGAGTLGLLEALDRYDPEKCDRFETFAEFRIKGAMLDELRRYDLMARNARLTAKRLNRTRHELTARLGRPPEEKEMAQAMQLGLDDYYKLVARVGNVHMLSLDELATPDDDAGGRSLQLQASVPSPEEVAGINESHDRLRGAIETLPERHQMVLEMYYRREMTLKEIGQHVGVTESRICQIMGEATGRLRKVLERDLPQAPQSATTPHFIRSGAARFARTGS
jgi:RNA polymerase sigma factor FliA